MPMALPSANGLDRYGQRRRRARADRIGPCSYCPLLDEIVAITLAVVRSRFVGHVGARSHRRRHLANGLPASPLSPARHECAKHRACARGTAKQPLRFSNAAHREPGAGDLPKESDASTCDRARQFCCDGQLPARVLDRYEFAGELSLSGELRRYAARWRWRAVTMASTDPAGKNPAR